MLTDKLRKEAARGSGDDGAECCYAPKWTCCDPVLLTQAAAEIEKLRADRDQYDSWAREIKVNIDAMRRENDELRAMANSALFHYWNCGDGCGKLRLAMAKLATAAGYSDPAVDGDIVEVLASEQKAGEK